MLNGKTVAAGGGDGRMHVPVLPVKVAVAPERLVQVPFTVPF